MNDRAHPVARSAPWRSIQSIARGPIPRVVLLTCALVVCTVALLSSLRHGFDPPRPTTWWIVAVVTVAFGLAERYSFHMEFRREAISFTLSEVPIALALVFMNPAAAIVARGVGSFVGVRSRRSVPWFKMCVNQVLYAFELAVAFALVHVGCSLPWLAEGRGWPEGATLLMSVTTALIAASFAGVFVITLVVATLEGNFVDRLVGGLRTGLVAIPLSSLLGSTALAPTLIDQRLLVMSFVPAVVVWYVLRRMGGLEQRNRDLESLTGFAGVVGGSLSLQEVLEAAVAETSEVMRADRCHVVVFDQLGTAQTAVHIGRPPPGLPQHIDDARWAVVLGASSAILLDGANVPATTPTAAAIGAPIRDESGVVGMLIIAERGGSAGGFDRHDCARTSALAAQLAPSVKNALLHAAIEHEALHDSLTDDLNRSGFDQLVGERLHTRGLRTAAVMMLDLDRFKEINDTLGHHVGDQVLIEVAARVRSHLDSGDLFARFGGDEFAIYAERDDLDTVRRLGDAIVSSSFTPMRLDDLDVVVTASVGIAPVTDDDRTVGGVLRRADIAMYAAKHGHTGAEFYREELDRRTPEHLSLLGDLRTALLNDQIDAHFQPKVDITTSTIVGAEALARWEHESRGFVPPEMFVAVAEESGLITQLTDLVLTKAIAQARRWHDAGFRLTVAVNLSTHDLLDELLPERVAYRLEEADLPPALLTLELTESSLLTYTPRTMATVQALTELGIRISLDDFGTGYSSLSYLRRLPATELKVDRSFVANVQLDRLDEVIVRSTIDLGHNLGLTVVAEGVENDEILARLAELGCDEGQGYGISRPLDAERFMRWLQTTAHPVAVDWPAPARTNSQQRPSTSRAAVASLLGELELQRRT